MYVSLGREIDPELTRNRVDAIRTYGSRGNCGVFLAAAKNPYTH